MRAVFDTNTLVSGDSHLLDLGSHRDIRIVSPAEAEFILLWA